MHDPEACEKKCQFVANRESIYVPRALYEAAELTPGRLVRAFFRRQSLEDLIIPIGRFTLPQWSGCAIWYLFQCRSCYAFGVDYLHGYRVYISCQNEDCRTSWHLRQPRFYEAAGLAPPLTLAEQHAALRHMYRRLRNLPPTT
jgi:hypothetical protein